MKLFADDITGCQLSFLWWQQPPIWRCILCKVDATRMRVKPFTVEASSAEDVLIKAKALAAVYEFPEVQRTFAAVATLDIELDLDL